ncbi:MAG: protein phosphatase CheZ [Pseudomonadota bacterium]
MTAKTYKFQALQSVKPTAGNGAVAPDEEWQNRIMDEIAALREQIMTNGVPVNGAAMVQTGSGGDQEGNEALPAGTGVPAAPGFSTEIQEALKLKRELDLIYEAITETKKEIASLSHVGFETGARPVDELDAVVKGTEQATNQILGAIELIEENANSLADTLTGDAGLLANKMQDEILRVYEACNFQDITGQRITKVVNVLRFISDRTEKMIDIWGGMDSFDDVPFENHKETEGDKALLNGPALDNQESSSQDDIDALFA